MVDLPQFICILDDSRAELAKHSVALELVPLLKSKTSAVAQEASSTMEKLTRLRKNFSTDYEAMHLYCNHSRAAESRAYPTLSSLGQGHSKPSYENGGY